MHINPINTIVYHCKNCQTVFKARLQDDSVVPKSSGKKDFSDLEDVNKEELTKKNDAETDYHNKKIVETIGADGNVYVHLEESDNKYEESPFHTKNVFTMYLDDIRDLSLLSAEEEAKLTEDYSQTRDEAVKQKLIKSNVRLVVHVAKRYMNMGLPMADLVAEGNLGLIKAAETFDETKDVMFYGYADKCISNSIIAALRNNTRTIRLPLSVQNNINHIKKATARFTAEFGRSPTKEEIAEITNFSEEKITSMIIASQNLASLDAPVRSDDNKRTVIDTIEYSPAVPANDFDDMQLKRLQLVYSKISQLGLMEQEVLSLKFGLNNKIPMSEEEIAFMHKTSKEEISKILNRVLRRLKKQCRKQAICHK